MNNQSKQVLSNQFLWITLFAIAMGFLETSVVVYLRALLYPKGFIFPLAPIPGILALTEIIRELATIIMLVTIGYISAKTLTIRFAWFLYAFAVWDLFYYIFLKILLNWPESFFTWDILFLIPITWVGPVLAPVIVSFCMIGLAMIILSKQSKQKNYIVLASDWILFVTGSLIVIVSFTLDYTAFLLEHYSFKKIWTIPADKLMNLSQSYLPRNFNWPIFMIGVMVILFGIVRYAFRPSKK